MGRMTLMGTLRPGAGPGDSGELRRRPRDLAPWLIALLLVALVPAFLGEAHFNALELFARFRAHAGPPRNRLCAPDRGQQRDREGSQDLRPPAFPHRSLSGAGHGFLRANRRLAVRRARWGGLFTALGTVGYYMAYAYSRGARCRPVLGRRPDIPRRLVPAPAQPARRPVASFSQVPARRSISTTCSRSSRCSRKSCRRKIPGRSRSRSPTDSSSKTWDSCIPGRSAGRCGAAVSAEGRRSGGPGRRKRRRQDDAGEAPGATLRSGRGAHAPRWPRLAGVRPRGAAANIGVSSRTSSATTSPSPTTSRSEHRGARRPAANLGRPSQPGDR